jgi:peptide/nickel transport system permease protein
MQRYILKRLLQGLITLLIVSVIIFVLARISGDPVTLLIDPMAQKSEYEEIKARLGLDKSYLVQYLVFMGNACRGYFGQSFWYKEPALDTVLRRFPATLQLGLFATLISILIAVPAGVLSAAKRGSIFDKVVMIIALIGQSAPIFWIGIVLMLFFSVILGVLPTSGMGSVKNLILPAITLGWYSNTLLLRITRSSMLDVLDTEYIKLARLEGLPERRVIWRHGLKNGAVSILTTIGFMLIAVVSGAVVTETVFAWPGVGRLLVESVVHHDFPVIQTIVLLIATGVVLINLLIDILYAYVDPRIRYR